jgi:iron complex transport system substrate-binding protein
MRIVSLLPAATEIAASLGAGDDLVGISHECDWPRDLVAGIDRVTESAIDALAPAGAIDAAVQEFVDAGRPLYALRDDRIVSLRPDVVITQAVCDVCAVSEGDVRLLAAQLDPAPVVVTLGGTTLGGVFDDITRVGHALDLGDRAVALIAELEGRMRHVHETLKAARAPRPRVAVIEWTDPVYVAGHWVPEMIRRAGGIDPLAEPGQHSRRAELDDVAASAPDVLIIGPCGYSLERAIDEARAVLDQPAWSWARGRAVWAVDANALVSRPGPRLIEGIETFARLMHPALFGEPDPALAVRLPA